MKIKSEFSIDKCQEKQMKEPSQLLEYTRMRAASALGNKIIELFPYVKDEKSSWPEGNPVPDPFECRAYSPVYDIYRCEIIVLSKPDWNSLGNALQHIILDVAAGRVSPDQAVKEAMQAIEHHCQPERP